jgi:hypothetical protein
VRTERPHEYLKLVASLLPKQIELKADPFEGVSDEELRALLDYARAQIAAAEQEGR